MAKPRKRRLRDQDSGEIEMTPMIDVVFQLLVYFVVTIKPVDVAAHLDVFRPSAGAPPKESTEMPKMIQIQIYAAGVLLMNGNAVSINGLERILGKLASYSKTQTVVIMCALDSDHKDLVEVLDRCAKVGLKNLSVVSIN
jgi:biopolymer transport protein ExbD